jgi:putative protease
MDQVELLAPARNLECGLAAIECGADAIYIGAARFGARASAGNRIEDIAALVHQAHQHWVRVYVTLNTLLRDDEFEVAQRLIRRLHDLGVDGLIIQDVGLLECDLPPLPLIASTQMHNDSPEKVAFLEQVGFRRVILARELSLEQIRAIRKAAASIELECFVHGALCVSYSGQCYLSYGLGGRSGNRGQCAQPCRKAYSLLDGNGRVLESGRHLLSLRDLNLSEHLGDLLGVGVRSFKIEGRLKDKAYVSNVVAHYRRALDQEMARAGLRKTSSGTCAIDFTPDPDKTFNRGYTTYFLQGRGPLLGAVETPKMVGTPLGRVTAVGPRRVELEARAAVHAGDGICYFDGQRRLRGSTVNAVLGQTVVLDRSGPVEQGTLIYRNHDHDFFVRLGRRRPPRKMGVVLRLEGGSQGLSLTAVDEDGIRAECFVRCEPQPARKPDQVLAALERQLRKTGGTEFRCTAVELELDPVRSLALSVVNQLRRTVLTELAARRAALRPRLPGPTVVRNDAPYPEKELSYLGNVLNRQAERFYRRHGVVVIEPAAESGLDMRGRKVMTTRYCLKHQLGLCPAATGEPPIVEPLTLIDEEGNRLALSFDCQACQMEVYCASTRLASEKTSRPVELAKPVGEVLLKVPLK